jgi:hypothetical protein
MQTTMSRRTLVKRGLIAAALVPAIGLIGNVATATALPPVDPDDPTAKGLGFVTDGRQVSISANPTFKATQKCSNCVQFQGKARDATGGCNIFAGHSVPAGGWCRLWAQRPGA